MTVKKQKKNVVIDCLIYGGDDGMKRGIFENL